MTPKMELFTVSYFFSILNIIAVYNDLSIWGLGFGLVSAVFLIKALRVK